MKIIYKPLDEIIPYERNPRDNTEAVDKVAASMQAFGFLVPIVLDENNIIVAGHTRLLAARKLGMKEVPTTLAEGLTEDEIKAYRLVDNRVSEMAAWDIPKLYDAIENIGDEINMLQFGFDFTQPEGPAQRLDNGMEFDEDDFSDSAFEYECPECGFRFSEA